MDEGFGKFFTWLVGICRIFFSTPVGIYTVLPLDLLESACRQVGPHFRLFD